MDVTKAKKGSDEYLIDYCDYVIGDLVKEKRDMIKAYNYFNGIRDHYQYENLEKNFGVGNPTSVGFTPLTRKHIEVIVGEYMSTKPKPYISCRDQRTLSAINREKQLEIAKQQKDYISKYLNNAIYKAIASNGQQQQGGGQEVQDELIDRELKRIQDSVSRNYISNFEIAAQDIITYTRQSRDIDFYNKVEQLVLDLLISGQAYYKVVPTHDASNYRIDWCDPLNTWVDKNPKYRYMKNAYKAVVRKWMTAEEIEVKYGDWLTDKQLKEVRNWRNFYEEESDYVMISGQSSRYGTGRGIVEGGVHPIDSDEDYYKWDLIPVYEVEWIDSAKKDGKWIGYTYHVTRIGQDIYILDMDNDIMMPRSMDEPTIPRLSINGIWYTNGHGGPYSLMLATAHLQDQYDMYKFKMDNYIALSGTRGAIVDQAALPENLGATPTERLKKFLAYRKQGLSLMDSAQEGAANVQNTINNGFDDSLQGGTIQGYQLALQVIEQTVSDITGVTPQRMGNIKQRDAVQNVEMGMQQSFVITERYYKAMDTLVKEILLDCIDMAKIVWPNGKMGEVLLGDEKKYIEILPQYYTTTSFGIDFKDSAEVIKEQDTVRQLSQAYLQSNLMDPEVLFNISTSDSLTEMKEMAMRTIQQKKAENNQLQQLQQQLQQLQDQNKQLQKQVEDSTKKIASLNEKKMQLEQQNMQMDQEIAYAKLQSEEKLKNRELDLIEKRTQLEALQTMDTNPNNDRIANDRY